MRKCYKYLIVIATCVALLACSVFSVGAVSWTSTTYNLSQSAFGSYIYTMPVFPVSEMDGYSFSTGDGGMNYQSYSFAQNSSNGNMFFTGSNTSSYPVVGLQYTLSNPIILRQNYRHKFSFNLGTDANHSTCTKVRIMFGDWNNDTLYATMYYYTFALNSGDWQSTTCNFEFDGLPNLNEIDTIWIFFERSSTTKVPRVWVNNQFVYQYVSSDAYWSGQVEDSVNGNINSSTNQINTNIQASTNEIKAEVQQGADQVAGEIQNSTDQITGGWQSNPEKPASSESVDDMTDIEQEIMDGSQEGIDSGNQVLSNFGGFLENWREGFIFVIGLFNILFANTWINSLIQIGLALGLIAFILNIAPSIARKISSGKKGGV